MPDQQQTPLASKEIATKLIANTMTLAADYVVDGGTYGISFNASAAVKEVPLKELLKPRIWIQGYYTTWQVLKFGFYPAFLAEIAWKLASIYDRHYFLNAVTLLCLQ